MQSVSSSPEAGIDPEAAAARYLEAGGRELDTGAALVVYCLGAETFYVAVLREAGDRWLIAAERTADIGGREFDALLLAYESGRHRDADPEFWDRVDNPEGDEDRELRAALLEEIRRARRRLAEETETVIAIPGAALELSLSRTESDASIRELVEQTVDLVEEVLDDASVAAGDLSGLLLAGDAARAPLVAAELRRRFEAEPVFSAGPLPYREAGPGTEADESGASEAGPGGRRVLVRSGVFATALLTLVAAGAAFGTRLGDHESPPSRAETSDSASEDVDMSDAIGDDASRSPSDPDSGQGGGERSPTPETEDEAADDPASPEADTPPESESEEPPTEAAQSGPVPDVTGLSAVEAEDELTEAGFTDVEFELERRSIFDFSHDNCEVIEQDPNSGSSHSYGETITVTYSHVSDDGSDCFE